jgi:ABC-type methionine transport system ATPase subunit
VFQSFNLIKRMSVAENVALPLIYAGVSRAKAHAKALLELERVGLKDYASARRTSCPAASSSGWRSPARWWAIRR